MYMKEPCLKQDLSLLPGTMTRSPLLTGATWDSVIMLKQSDGRLLGRTSSQRTVPCKFTALVS